MAFRAKRLGVVKEQLSELFYSGNILLGTLMGMQKRRKLAYLLGSSARLFKVVRSTEGMRIYTWRVDDPF